MFIIGIIGILMLLWYLNIWLWTKFLPWLIVAVIVTSTIGWITDHWVIVLILVIVGFVFYGAYLEDKKRKLNSWYRGTLIGALF